MEHILKFVGDEIDFDRYQKYLVTIEDKLPAHIYAFASDPKYYDLQSPTSLHDAWLEECTIKENGTGERNEIRMIEVHLTLLGPFHDRQIHLRYHGVSSYSFETLNHPENSRETLKNHGDLYTHEIRLSPDGSLIHELLFERGTLLIECADFLHSEELIIQDKC
jgi:hypothetical protein